MKSLKFFVLVLLCCSCGNSDKTNNLNLEAATTKKELTLSIDFKTTEPDFFKIAMNNIVVDEFQKKSIQFSENVYPTSSFDNITVVFDTNNPSKDILFIPGNKKNKVIEIQALNLNFGNKDLKINSSEIRKNVSINKYVKYDSINNNFVISTIDGQLYPVIKLKRGLINRLTKE
ncbi:hypothetical protein [Winogradskyella sp.]|uniref:hypothetical protein n=1 Tax=Winogradskyella sp. TaxID=1883156 RepID=UPI0026122DB9|nr:hypothetical protein [Winogradskyella sp.]